MKTFERWISVPGYGSVMATLYLNSAKSEKTVIIGSAIGTRRSYYHKFASFLSGMDYNVISYDNGGIGESTYGSLRRNKATLTQWAKELDAVIYFGISHWNTTEIYYVGHSIGGQLLALSKRSSHFKKIILVGSQMPYWKLWPSKLHSKLFMHWYFTMPICAMLFGKLPGFVKFPGIPLPKGVALEWARWARNPEGLYAYNSETFAKSISAPILAISFSDDWIAPREACEALMYKFYHAPVRHLHLSPGELNLKRIGHFGFFKKECEDTLWHELIKFLRRADELYHKERSELTSLIMPLLKTDFDLPIRYT